MIYAMSDLHGCYEKYIQMLRKLELTENDTLYILGDVVDRGEGGIRILQDMMTRRNVIPLRGNHDYLAYRLLNMLDQPPHLYDTENVVEMYQMWLLDGGAPTLRAFRELPTEEQKKILSYLDSFWIYEDLEVNGRKFFLSHTVPGKDRMQQFERLTWTEFIIGEPEYDKEYFPDTCLVTGHTPTGLIDPDCSGRICRQNNHIAIDCGAVFGSPLGCICLDTLEEFYVE